MVLLCNHCENIPLEPLFVEGSIKWVLWRLETATLQTQEKNLNQSCCMYALTAYTGIAHQNIYILSSFTHLILFQTFFKTRKKVLISWICLWNGSLWGQKQHWTPLIFIVQKKKQRHFPNFYFGVTIPWRQHGCAPIKKPI